MNFPFLEFPIRDLDKIASLQQLRERLLNALLVSAFLLGTVLYAVAVIPVFEKGLFEFPVIYTLIYLWVIAVTFVRRIPYLLRAASFLLFLYVFGLINLILSGFNADGGLFFLTYVSMSALLFDLRRGFIALGITVVTLTLAGALMVTGIFSVQLESPQPTDPLLWIIGGGVFIMTSLFLILALTALLRGLVANLSKARLESEKLETSNQALQASERRYRALVEMSPDLVTLLGLDGRVILTNQPGLALFGYERTEETAGRHYLEFVAPEDRLLLDAAFHMTLETGSANGIECHAIRKDGSFFHAEFSASLIADGSGAPQAVMAVGRDITARKETERLMQDARAALETMVRERTEELRRTGERLSELVARSPVVIYASRPEKNYPAIFCSENVRDVLGHSPEQFTSAPDFWVRRIHPEDAARVLAETARIFESGEVLLEYRFRHADGEYRWMRDNMRLARSPEGQPLEIVGSWIDISAQKQVEESHRILLENSKHGIIVFQDERIVYVNRAITEEFGYTLDDVKSFTPEDMLNLFIEEDRGMMARRVQARRGGEPVPANFEIRTHNNKGDLRVLDAVTVPIRFRGKPALQTTLVDITERKRMEQSIAAARDELEVRVTERTRELLESQEQLRKLTKEVVLAQEEERRRVSRELHDEAGQALVSMKYGLESILSDLPDGNLPLRTRLAAAIRQLDETMEEIRHLAHSLRPPLFDIADLDLTLRDYCREFGETTGMQVEYTGEPMPDLAEEIGLSFFRFLQESLTNVVKHANATRVEVILARRPGELCLSVKDNGLGLDAPATDGRGHLGMRERFKMLNGGIQIESQAGAGFAITASIPREGMSPDDRILA